MEKWKDGIMGCGIYPIFYFPDTPFRSFFFVEREVRTR